MSEIRKLEFNKTPSDIFKESVFLKFRHFQMLLNWLIEVSLKIDMVVDLSYIFLSILKYVEENINKISNENFQTIGICYFQKYTNAFKLVEDIKFILNDSQPITTIERYLNKIPVYEKINFKNADSDNVVFSILKGNIIINAEIETMSFDECFSIISTVKGYEGYASQKKEILSMYDTLDFDHFRSYIKDMKQQSHGLYSFLYVSNYQKIDAKSNMKATNFYSKLSEDEPPFFEHMCSMLKNYTDEVLGKGTYGSAYSLKRDIEAVQNYFGDRDLVVKEIKTSDLADCYSDRYKINTKRAGEKPIILKNLFVCKGENTAIGEFFASLIVSKLKSDNFIDTFAFKDCVAGSGISKRSAMQLIFMEKIDGTMLDLVDNLSEKEYIDLKESNDINAEYFKKIDVMAIQLLHALDCMHSIKMNHNDPHPRNIFYVKVDENTRLKNGDLLSNYACVKYKFSSGVECFIPVRDLKYIIKLGDFGLSCKYSEPYLMNDVTQEDWALDYFCPLYDLMLAFSLIRGTSPFYKMIQLYLFEGERAIDLINKTYDVDEFDKWYDSIKNTLDPNCENVKYLNNIRNVQQLDTKEMRLKKLATDNYYSKFLCWIFKYNKNTKRIRQNYNFSLEDMSFKDHINIPDLIDKDFFQHRLSNLGYFDDYEGEVYTLGDSSN
jgi:hypothetical protein